MTNSRLDKVGDILRASTEYLASRDAYEPRQACELLLSRLLNCGRLELYVKFETRLAEKQLEAMRRGVKRLAAGEPIQYIIGRIEFMRRSFKVDRRALIPRPETELLVETVLGCEILWQRESPVVCEIGTGCGCIIISLAHERRGAKYTAIDVSEEALQLAAENAALLGVADSIFFAGGELADAVEPDSLDAIVANLPYVSTGDWQSLPVHIRAHEPRVALDGGEDGLTIIGMVVPDAWFALKPGGWLFLEIGADQGEKVAGLLNAGEFEDVQVRKDLAGKDRIVSARRKRDF